MSCYKSRDNCTACSGTLKLVQSFIDTSSTQHFTCSSACATDKVSSSELSQFTSTAICLNCHASCATCTDKWEFTCSSCKSGLTLTNGQCLGKYFNASLGGEITATFPYSQSSFSLVLWFYPTSAASGFILKLFDIRDPTAYSSEKYAFKIESNVVALFSGDGSQVSTGRSVTITAWHYLTMSVDGEMMQVSVDGELDTYSTFASFSLNAVKLGACNCDLASLTLFKASIRANEFRRGLSFSIAHPEANKYPISVYIGLMEGSGKVLSSNQLDYDLSSDLYWRTNSNPLVRCPLAKTQAYSSGLCVNCPDNCELCYSSSDCAWCSDGYAILRDTGKCLSTAAGKYIVRGEWRTCMPKCETCSDSSTCETCNGAGSPPDCDNVKTIDVLKLSKQNDFTFSLDSTITTPPWTLEVWLKLIDTIGEHLAFGAFKIQDGVSLAQDSTSLNSVSVSAGTWSHYAVTLGTGNLKWYQDSNSVYDNPYSGSNVLGQIVVGRGKTQLHIREVRAWTAELTQLQLRFYKQYYRDDAAAVPSSLTRAWRLAEFDSLNTIVGYPDGSLDFTQYMGLPREMTEAYFNSQSEAATSLCKWSEFMYLSTDSPYHCAACSSSCDSELHCQDSTPTSCEACDSMYYDVSGTCKPILKVHSQPSYSEPIVLSSSLATWSLHFWLKIQTTPRSAEAIIEVSLSSQLQWLIAAGPQSQLGFKRVIEPQFSQANSLVYSSWQTVAVTHVPGLFLACYFGDSEPITLQSWLSDAHELVFASTSLTEYRLGNLKLWDTALELGELKALSLMTTTSLSSLKYVYPLNGEPTEAKFTDLVVSRAEAFNACRPHQSWDSSTELCQPCDDSNCLSCENACSACNTASSRLEEGECKPHKAHSTTATAVTYQMPTDLDLGFTVSFWVRYGEVSGQVMQFARESDTLTLLSTSAQLKVNRYPSSSYMMSGLSTTLSSSFQLVYLIRETNGDTYLNSDSNFRSDTSGYFVPTTLYIGGVKDKTAFLRSIVVFSRPMTDSQVKLYSNNFPVAASRGVVFYFPLTDSGIEAFSGQTAAVNLAEVTDESIWACNLKQRYGEETASCFDCADTNCLKCSTHTSKCEFCEYGYRLTTSFTCEQCASGLDCMECTDYAGVCTSCGYLATRSSDGCQCSSGTFLNKADWVCEDCYETCETCSDTSTSCLACKASPIEAVGTLCKYLGIFPTSASYQQYLSVCASQASPACSNEFLAQYCCPLGSLEAANCVFKVRNSICRPCTFESTSVCDASESACWVGLLPIDPVTDACLKHIYDYCCESHAATYDCSAFNYKFQCDLIKPPSLLHSDYSSDFQSLSLIFSNAVDISKFISSTCAIYFSGADLLSLGSGSLCYWTADQKTLVVVFGSKATVTTGPISLKSNTIKTSYSYATTYGIYSNVSLNYPNTLPAPTARVNSPSSISYCSDLTLDGSGSAGSLGRQLTFSWTLSSDTGNSAFVSFASQFATESTQRVVVLPSKVLDAYSEVTVKLVVKNYLGQSNAVSSVISVSGQSIPAVRVQGGASFDIKAADSSYFPLEIISPGCAGLPSSYDIEWTLLSTNATTPVDMQKVTAAQPNSRTFAVVPGLLQAPAAYTFQAKVTPVGNQINDAGFTRLSLTLSASPLFAIISGGGRKLAYFKGLTLSGRGSSDPDNPEAQLDYSWSCESSEACPLQLTGQLLNIPAYTFKASLTYKVTLTVSANARSSKASTLIEVVSQDLPGLSVNKPSKPVDPSSPKTLSVMLDVEGSYTVSWALVSGSAVRYLSPLTQSSIRIDSLSPGFTYVFEVKVSSLIGSVSVLLDFKVNSPPTSGSLSLSPTSGEELKTTFVMQAMDWLDFEGDLPLTYSYSFKRSSENLLSLSPRTVATQCSSFLSKGEGSILLRVYDSLNSYSEATAPIVVSVGFSSAVEKAEYIDALVANLTSTRDIQERDQSLPSQVSAISKAAFADTAPSSQNSNTYASLIGLMADWTSRQGTYPHLDAILASTLAEMTQQPSSISVSARSSTLSLARQISFEESVSSGTQQSAVTLLSNLEESRVNATDSESLAQGNEIKDILIDFSRSFNKAAVLNQEPVTIRSGNIAVLASRSSTAGLSSKTLALTTNSHDVRVMLPSNLLPADIQSNEGVDSVLSVFKSKDYSLLTNSSTIASVYDFVGGTSAVSFALEVAGSQNEYGEFSLYSEVRAVRVSNLTEPVQISIPATSLGVGASPNCTWLNETANLWQTSGCTFSKVDAALKLIICNCTHLTQFSAQDSTEGLSEAAGSANTDEATNFAAITEIDFTGNAAGLYVAGGLLVLYTALGIVCRLKDKRDAEYEHKLRTDPQCMIEHDIRTSPTLYNDLMQRKQEDQSFGIDESITNIFPETNATLFKTDKIQENSLRTPDELFYEQNHIFNTETSVQIYARYMGYKLEKTDPRIDLTTIRPPQRTYTVNENLLYGKRKTLWELIVLHHSIIGLLFRTNVYFTRLARITILFAGVFGKLLASGFFYDSSAAKESEKDKTMTEIFEAYTWTDFWLAVLSALLVVPLVVLLGYLFKMKVPDDTMSPEEVTRLIKRNRLRSGVAYSLAWGFMAFCGYEITIFSIQFNQNVSSLWMTTFSLSTAYDMLVQMSLLTAFKILVARLIYP